MVRRVGDPTSGWGPWCLPAASLLHGHCYCGHGSVDNVPWGLGPTSRRWRAEPGRVARGWEPQLDRRAGLQARPSGHAFLSLAGETFSPEPVRLLDLTRVEFSCQGQSKTHETHHDTHRRPWRDNCRATRGFLSSHADGRGWGLPAAPRSAGVGVRIATRGPRCASRARSLLRPVSYEAPAAFGVTTQN